MHSCAASWKIKGEHVVRPELCCVPRAFEANYDDDCNNCVSHNNSAWASIIILSLDQPHKGLR